MSRNRSSRNGMKLAAGVLLAHLSVVFGGATALHALDDEDDDKSKTTVSRDFEKLLELNAETIFGGSVKINGDAFEVSFDKDGQVKAGFDGRGLIDSKSDEMTGAQRGFIIQEKKDDVEKLVPGLAAVGLGKGAWVSRFPIAGEVWVEFGFRVPNLLTQQSDFRLRVNWKKRSGYETAFFQTISYVSRGSAKSKKATPHKEYQKAASNWFPRKKESVKIGFGFKEGACVVRMNDREMVVVPDVPDRGGHIAVAYNKIVFTIDHLKISGKLDREWCKKEIERLRRKGDLKTAPGADEDKDEVTEPQE